MKSKKPASPKADPAADNKDATEAAVAKPADLGLTERRNAIRPLPVPEAVESDGDTDWAAFQALVAENSKQ